jgi:uncharacterized membrane protein
MESLFYTISGLPVHALVVHFAVVILPFAASAFIAMVYMPKLKSKYSFITIVAIVLGAAAAFVAKQSGEALAEHIGNPVKHANYASILTALAFILAALSILWYRSAKGRRSRVVTPLGHVSVLVALAVLGLTFLTGHTGAEAVWKGRLSATTSTSSPAPSATATSKVAGTYNSADLAKHATSASCWSAINGNVYDLTKWINRHPGGASVIKAICGRDGTASFNGQHAGATRPANELTNYKIGKFA